MSVRHALRPSLPWFAFVVLAAAWLAPLRAQEPPAAAAPDLARAPVRLPALGGWNAFLLLDNGKTGIWTVEVRDLFPQYAAPEVIGLDDAGECHVLVQYSGTYTHRRVLQDGKWLGALAAGDVDPRQPGTELYVGGAGGNVYQVLAHLEGMLDGRRIAHFPGLEVHTLVAGDVDPRSPGAEVLAFASPGAVYRLAPTGRDGTFACELLQRIEGRVRDAVVLPGQQGPSPWIATASRSGELALLRLTAAGAEWRTIHRAVQGFGRIAVAPPSAATAAEVTATPAAAGATRGDSAPLVLYTTLDDGCVLRHEGSLASDAEWRTELIFAGPQGPRGVVAGRFFADPAVESVAVFGYSANVQLLHRRAGEPWRVETIFTDRDRGHWLEAAELDGRNATDELVGSGYGGRVFLLARPPGYGLDVPAAAEPPLEPALAPARVSSPPASPLPASSPPASSPPASPLPASPPGSGAKVVRIATKAGAIATTELSPLRYQGGFETKTMVYETLVRRDADGRIAPGLASAWRIEDGGRTFVFTLREGATFHDGSPVTAADVAMHFRRWVGLPEHAWLRCSERITAVSATGRRELRVSLDRPHALLPDLCVVNPTAVRGPAALDDEGNQVRAVGSGPFRLCEVREGGRVLRYAHHQTGRPAADVELVDLVRLDGEAAADPLLALLRDEVDAVIGSWLVRVDPNRAASLRQDPRFEVVDGPGSSVTWLAFRLEGPTAEVDVRRAVAAAIDREELVRAVEHGFADPCTAWAAPSVRVWPQGAPAADAIAPSRRDVPALATPLRLDAGSGGARSRGLAMAIATQLRRAGLPVEVLPERREGTRSEAAWDLRLEATHGVPYDPHTTLVSRFARPASAGTSAPPTDPRLCELVERAVATPDEEPRRAVHAEIQRCMDERALLVPLYAPRRIAVLRRGLPAPRLSHDMYALDPSWLLVAANGQEPSREEAALR